MVESRTLRRDDVRIGTVDRFTVFTCDLGWRTLSFLRIAADSGAEGWAEFTEDFGNQGLAGVVHSLRDAVMGRDPRPVSLIIGELTAQRAPAPGSLNRQAIAAVENALYDLKARSLGISVAELLGGPVRTRIPVYWSHCGTYRQGERAQVMGVDPIRSYSELADFASTIPATGMRYVKTNLMGFDSPSLQGRGHPWARHPAAAGRLWDDECTAALEKTLSAFRDGFGDEIGLMVDLNTGYRADAVRRIERSLRHLGLAWIELDGLAAATLADVRRSAETPMASGESLFGRGEYLPHFEHQSLDVAIVDVVWNGIAESVRIASDAETRGLSIAPHNFYGHLSTYMAAQYCAAIPNVEILEVDLDGVPWRDDFVSAPPQFEGGELMLPSGAGWGVEVNEQAVRERAVAVLEGK